MGDGNEHLSLLAEEEDEGGEFLLYHGRSRGTSPAGDDRFLGKR